jgi:hypothetical protein
MKTVIVKFVVKNQAEADSLMNEIGEDLGNNAGFPYLESEIRKATGEEIKAHKELTK